MINIEALCEYQKAYQEKEKIQKFLYNSQIQRDYLKAKSDRDVLKEQVNELSTLVTNQYNTLYSEKDNFKKIEEVVSEILDNDFSDMDDDALDYLLKKLNENLDNISTLKINTQKENIELTDSLKKLRSTAIAFNDISKKRDILKVQYEEFQKKEIVPKLQVIQDKINEIKDKKLNESEAALFEETKKVLQSNTVLVPLMDKNCALCSSELSSSDLASLNENGYVKCPSCGRIVFKK